MASGMGRLPLAQKCHHGRELQRRQPSVYYKDEFSYKGDTRELLEDAIKVQLRIAMATDDPTSEASKELVCMHSCWIKMHWGEDAFNEKACYGLEQGI